MEVNIQISLISFNMSRKQKVHTCTKNNPPLLKKVVFNNGRLCFNLFRIAFSALISYNITCQLSKAAESVFYTTTNTEIK